MHFSIIVRVSLANSQTVLPGARIQLLDRDIHSADDLLGEGVTGPTGEVRFEFDTGDFADRWGTFDDPSGIFAADQIPDLYVRLLDAAGEVAVSTRPQAVAGPISVILPLELGFQQAIDLGLVAEKPRPDPSQSKQDWFERWRRRLAADPAPPTDLCWTRAIIDTIAQLDAPQSEMAQRLATEMANRFDPDAVQQVAEAAARARDSIDESALSWVNDHGLASAQVLLGGKCSASVDFAEMVKLAGDPSTITQSLNPGAPPPGDRLPEPGPGLPFGNIFAGWYDKCEERYDNGLLAGEALEQMKSYYPDGLALQRAPSVNKVTVYDLILAEDVRIATPSNKRVRFTHFGADGEIDMAVPIGGENCLVYRPDPLSEDGQEQIMVVDVRGGQEILLQGGGFTAESAVLTVERWRWDDDAEIDSAGRLLPGTLDDQFDQDKLFNGMTLPVHGAPSHGASDHVSTFVGDMVLFQWPEEFSEPGLYRLYLDFGQSSLPSHVSQDPDTCLLQLDHDLRTPDLWFVILPARREPEVRVRLGKVTCVDEKDPETYLGLPAGDLLLAVGTGGEMVFDGQNVGQEIDAVPQRSATREFMEDGAEWVPELSEFTLWPATGSDTLNEDRAVLLIFSSQEIVSETEKYIITAIIVAVILALILIVVIIVGAATTVGWSAAIQVGWTVALKVLANSGVIYLVVDAIFTNSGLGVSPIGSFETIWSGAELAHLLSSVRFHRALWAHEVPEGPEIPQLIHTSRERAVFPGDRINDTFECTNPNIGSKYRFRVVAEIVE